MAASNPGDDFHAPMRFEAQVEDCIVEGTLPAGLHGTFYRSCADRRFPPLYPNDTPYNADGAIDMFRFYEGHVDFKSRYVRTPRYKAERAAHKALFGLYRNRNTSDPGVRDLDHGSANTTPIYHGGRLFCLKEESLPVEVNPHTLETIGPWDFEGAVKSTSFTAHPKLDPLTGEMLAFAYEAKGDATDDLAVFVFDSQGKLSREIWFKSPVVSMMHDMAITDRHIILPTTSMVSSAQRLAKGEIHWAHDPTVPAHVAIIPRDGKASDVRWFTGTPAQSMLIHTLNARTVGNRVILEAPVCGENFHPYFPRVDGSRSDPAQYHPTMRRWTFDLDSNKDTWDEEILFDGMQVTTFTRMDDRYLGKPFTFSYMLMKDPQVKIHRKFVDTLAVRISNAWYRFNHHTGEINKFSAGDSHGLSEPQFVPRHENAAEGDGYLIGVANDFSAMKSELVVVDALDLEAGAIARVKLPFRLHMQVHGLWVPARELPFQIVGCIR